MFQFLIKLHKSECQEPLLFEHLKKQIGHTFWLKKEAEKHRYLYFLGNKKENKLFMNTIKHPLLPYPKEALNKAEVIKYEVDNKGIYNES